MRQATLLSLLPGPDEVATRKILNTFDSLPDEPKIDFREHLENFQNGSPLLISYKDTGLELYTIQAVQNVIQTFMWGVKDEKLKTLVRMFVLFKTPTKLEYQNDNVKALGEWDFHKSWSEGGVIVTLKEGKHTITWKILIKTRIPAFLDDLEARIFATAWRSVFGEAGRPALQKILEEQTQLYIIRGTGAHDHEEVGRMRTLDFFDVFIREQDNPYRRR